MDTDLRRQVLKEWADHGPRDAARKAAQTPPEGVDSIRNLAYLPDGDKRWEHRLDIFKPKGSEEFLPVIVDVHGGGWLYGNKELNEYYCMSLAQRGFLVADINYTLVPDTDLKGQAGDITAAVNWCFEHIKEYGGDAERLCLTGDSAGAHLAMLVCGAAGNSRYRSIYQIPPFSGKVRALGLVCPASVKALATDLDPLRRYRCEMIYGGKPYESPLWPYSDGENLLADCQFPPIFLLTTKGDKIQYPWAVSMKWLLEKAGQKYQYVEWPASKERPLGHVFNVLHHEYAESEAANTEMTEFFQQAFQENVQNMKR